MLMKLLITLFGAPTAYAVYKIILATFRGLRSPLRILPGPPRQSWLLGNVPELFKDDDNGLMERWVELYGTTIKWFGLFGEPHLYTIDTKFIQHILSHTDVYQKSEGLRSSLARVVGPGVLVVEGNQHKQQRKIMNPAFGPTHMRELTPIFLDKAAELRDIWLLQANATTVARVDALSWLSKVTLDIIGVAGFNYQINSLAASSEVDDHKNELAAAFETIFAAETGFSVWKLFQHFIPVLRWIPTTTDRNVTNAHKSMVRVGRKLLQESKRDIESDDRRAKDLLSLLVRANTAKDVPETQRLADEDVIAQVPTFLVAGHETTSTAVTWALFELTQHPAIQERLRAELRSVPSDEPSSETLNTLPFLDYVVRETLRMHAPVPSTSRVALQDDVVPLATPFTDSKGLVHETIRITKGQSIMIPILALNRVSGIWGDNGMAFAPDRWDKPPSGANAIPGIWGHTLTFLGGPRSCIGYRFALDEMKAILFTLVRAFEFELAVPGSDIGKKATAIVERPIVRSQREKGFQLPLLVRPVPVASVA
ncbi:cytochrome P450 [Mycena amicta]|nr:cytochrome P450 [Mycena amicta]